MISLNDINVATPEGKLLFGAIALVTMAPKLLYDGGKEVNGQTLTPEDAIEIIRKSAGHCGIPYAVTEEDFKGKAAPEHTFFSELSSVINYYSRENGSNTPDRILAEYMNDCLLAFDKATNAREIHYGREAAEVRQSGG